LQIPNVLLVRFTYCRAYCRSYTLLGCLL